MDIRMRFVSLTLPLSPVTEIFNLVDRDKGGSISKSELAQLMDTLQINASQQEIDLMIGEIDANNDGEIQFEEVRGRTQSRHSSGMAWIMRVHRLWRFHGVVSASSLLLFCVPSSFLCRSVSSSSP